MSARLIQSVSDTAFMVAAHRAIESSRADALFHDPLADRLAGEHGRNIVQSLRATTAMTAWTVAIRTRIIDELILRATENGVDGVLNLGAGLDTRPYRLRVPAPLLWVEVDQPAVIELKERALAQEKPACRLQRVGLDLTSRATRQSLFARIEMRARNVLVLTEGVVPYLANDEAAALADDLRMRRAFRQWIVDYFSPETLKYRERSGIARDLQNAPWRFRPSDYDEFFAAHGWKRRETRYLAIEAQRLNRPPPLPWLLRWWTRVSYLLAPEEKREALLKSAGYVVFEQGRG